MPPRRSNLDDRKFDHFKMDLDTGQLTHIAYESNGQLTHSGYGTYDTEYRQHPKEVDLDSTSTLVLLRHLDSKYLHLLHHRSTALGDRLQITSSANSSPRQREIQVKISAEHTYCYKSLSTPNMQPGGGLLIPKKADGDTPKKCCKVYINYMCSEVAKPNQTFLFSNLTIQIWLLKLNCHKLCLLVPWKHFNP